MVHPALRSSQGRRTGLHAGRAQLDLAVKPGRDLHHRDRPWILELSSAALPRAILSEYLERLSIRLSQRRRNRLAATDRERRNRTLRACRPGSAATQPLSNRVLAILWLQPRKRLTGCQPRGR